MMNSNSESKVQISDVYETDRDPDSGKGLMGFVITFPDGRIENLVLDYDTEDHDETLRRITQMRNNFISGLVVKPNSIS